MNRAIFYNRSNAYELDLTRILEESYETNFMSNVNPDTYIKLLKDIRSKALSLFEDLSGELSADQIRANGTNASGILNNPELAQMIEERLEQSMRDTVRYHLTECQNLMNLLNREKEQRLRRLPPTR